MKGTFFLKKCMTFSVALMKRKTTVTLTVFFKVGAGGKCLESLIVVDNPLSLISPIECTLQATVPKLEFTPGQ